jgi:hypothetical protein
MKLKEPGAAITPRPAGPQPVVEENSNPFHPHGGSRVPAFNGTILRETLSTLWCPNPAEDTTEERRAIVEANNERCQTAACAALIAFKPKDEIEGMLAAQAVALHFGAMECFRRAMIGEQPGDVASKLRRDGANLARSMTDMLEALDRKRGKGPQVVRVERVTVQSGGQAIVGAVTAGAGPHERGEG